MSSSWLCLLSMIIIGDCALPVHSLLPVVSNLDLLLYFLLPFPPEGARIERAAVWLFCCQLDGFKSHQSADLLWHLSRACSCCRLLSRLPQEVDSISFTITPWDFNSCFCTTLRLFCWRSLYYFFQFLINQCSRVSRSFLRSQLLP